MLRKVPGMTVKEYLNEPMVIGGLPTTRGEFIQEMRVAGVPQRCIDLYLFGWEKGRAQERGSDPCAVEE